MAPPWPSRVCHHRRLWTKLGQYLASRSDVVPQPIVSRLATMLDSNEPRPYATQGLNPGLTGLEPRTDEQVGY